MLLVFAMWKRGDKLILVRSGVKRRGLCMLAREISFSAESLWVRKKLWPTVLCSRLRMLALVDVQTEPQNRAERGALNLSQR